MPPDSASSTTTPGQRYPEPEERSVRTWSGKGQHRTALHNDPSSKCNKAWARQDIKESFPACDVVSRDEIAVNILGQAVCLECGHVPSYDKRGALCCRCTVWNEGIPRPSRTIRPKPDVIRIRQLRRFAKQGRS